MSVAISRAVLDAVLAAAADAAGGEVCGLLLGDPAPSPASTSPSVRPEPIAGQAANDPARNTSPSAGLQALGTGVDFARDERVPFRREEASKDERIVAAVPTVNVAADPARNFELDPAALFAAIRAERAGGPRIVGHYHSHPNGSFAPSARDAAMAGQPGRLWLIVARGAARLWRETRGGQVQGAFEAVPLVVTDGEPGCA